MLALLVSGYLSPSQTVKVPGQDPRAPGDGAPLAMAPPSQWRPRRWRDRSNGHHSPSALSPPTHAGPARCVRVCAQMFPAASSLACTHRALSMHFVSRPVKVPVAVRGARHATRPVRPLRSSAVPTLPLDCWALQLNFKLTWILTLFPVRTLYHSGRQAAVLVLCNTILQDI